MLKTISLKSMRYAKYQTKEIKPKLGERTIFHRQNLIPNFEQMGLADSQLLFIGAGGINGEVAEGSVRKGAGHIIIADGDIVEITNLNRQKFHKEDIGKNKALCLAKNLAKDATGSTTIEAYGHYFEELRAKGKQFDADVVVCGVDSDKTRAFVSRDFIGRAPVIFIAVSEDADHGYVLIQEKGGRPCFHCLYPDNDQRRMSCTPAGAVKDILKVVGGIALYAIDTLIMPRKRDWNYRHISLAGFAPDTTKRIKPRQDCPICQDIQS
jgi:molybdopterin/thiamine biosynthesis adenylyltransferase